MFMQTLRVAALLLLAILDLLSFAAAGKMASMKNDLWIVSIVLLFSLVVINVHTWRILYKSKHKEDVTDGVETTETGRTEG